jgi:D-alanyl-D-alanine carboxypeptidase
MHPIEAELQRLVTAGFPGGFVYLEESDGTSQFFTAGVADLETQRSMTPNDHYRIGSTTKTFTAVVALQLMKEGRLSLSDTVQQHLPDLAVPQADILTIEYLMQMRSGLFDFEDDPELAGNLDVHLSPVTLERAVQLGIQHEAQFVPGTRFRYCNTNFCVLEMIIERVTGNPLGVELQRRIFQPLTLNDTAYPEEQDLTLPEPYIRGYERTVDGWRECSQVFFGRGDGAIISTARDLARFFRALLIDQTLLTKDVMQQMMSVIDDNPPAEERYGLGLMPESLPCGQLWGHSGGGYGYGNMPYVLMETGRFGVVMLNGSYGFHADGGANIPPRPRFSSDFRAQMYC